MKFKPKPEDKRNFLKIKAGETVGGVFRGELYEFRMHWSEGRGILCTGEHCDLCLAGNKSKGRFRINFITKDGHEYVAKVWEQGYTVYDQLRTLNEGDYPLEKHVIKITRTGEKLNTSYTFLPAPNGIVTPELEKKLEAVPLNDLGHITESETEQPIPDLSDIPF